MLGALYRPSGLALEQAQAVLEVREPHAVNVALGCVNGCVYCYGPMASRQGKKWGSVRLPKMRPVELVGRQLANGLDVEGVFLSFLTDPYLPQLKESTEELISYLDDRDITVATSSKLGVSDCPWNRNGMTIVSPSPGFSEKYEPGVPSPDERIRMLAEQVHDEGFTWVSMEPWPVYDIYPYDMKEVLAFWESLSFVDLIVFGKWNYDARARTEKARIEYAVTVKLLKAFCEDHDISLHVKSATLRFIEGGKKMNRGST